MAFPAAVGARGDGERGGRVGRGHVGVLAAEIAAVVDTRMPVKLIAIFMFFKRLFERRAEQDIHGSATVPSRC